MSLGSQVEKYRNQVLKLKFAQLSDLSGVDVGTINAMEKRDSNRADIRAAIAIAGALGLTLEELADEQADHSAKVKAHMASAYTKNQRVTPLLASDLTSKPWASGHWPFPNISPERFKAALDTHDVDRIEAYAKAIIETREAEALKNVG
jgi:transcriptional regulator with XRE-family HTH domain